MQLVDRWSTHHFHLPLLAAPKKERVACLRFLTAAYRSGLRAATNRRHPLLPQAVCHDSCFSARSEPRGVTPPAANSAFRWSRERADIVGARLSHVANHIHTNCFSVSKGKHPPRHRDNWVLSTCCTASCTSARLRPLTRSGPTSGRDTRPLPINDPHKSLRDSTPKIDREAITGADKRSLGRREDPSEWPAGHLNCCEKSPGQIARLAAGVRTFARTYRRAMG